MKYLKQIWQNEGRFPGIYYNIVALSWNISLKKWDEEDLLFSFIEVDLKKYLGVAPNFNMSHQGTEAANKTEKFWLNLVLYWQLKGRRETGGSALLQGDSYFLHVRDSAECGNCHKDSFRSWRFPKLCRKEKFCRLYSSAFHMLCVLSERQKQHFFKERVGTEG